MEKGILHLSLGAVVLENLEDFVDGVIGIIKNGHRLLLLFFIISRGLLLALEGLEGGAAGRVCKCRA
jgi:hypothetical protein